MPMLDMTVVLTDPQFLDSFTVLRRKQVANKFGESKVSVEQIPKISGIVFPEGKNDLARRAEAQTTAKTITVITGFPLRGQSQDADSDATFQPDIIYWRGDRFVVVSVEDYSNFSRGFVKVTATSIDLGKSGDQPPKPTTQSTDTQLIEPGYGRDPFGGGSFPDQQ